LCGVGTQLHQAIPGFDDSIGPQDSDFSASGLKAPSLIRLGYLAVLPEARLLGSIGALSPQRHHRLLERLAAYLIVVGERA